MDARDAKASRLPSLGLRQALCQVADQCNANALYDLRFLYKNGNGVPSGLPRSRLAAVEQGGRGPDRALGPICRRSRGAAGRCSSGPLLRSRERPVRPGWQWSALLESSATYASAMLGSANLSEYVATLQAW